MRDVRFWRFAATLVGAATLAIAAAAPPAGAAGPLRSTSPTDPAPPTTSADELDQQVAGLTNDLDAATAEVDAATAALTAADDQLTTAQRLHDAASAAADAAATKLSRYAIVAYVAGGKSAEVSVVDLSDPSQRSSDAEDHRVLVTSVGTNLIDTRRQAATDLRRAESAEAGANDADLAAEQRLQQATARRDELTGRVQSTRAEAEQAHHDEDERLKAQAEQASASRLAGAGEGPPNVPSVNRSGVVPGSLAPGQLAALLAIEMPQTALEAYWRAAQRLATEQPACGIDWALIGGIGLVETRHGTYLGSNPNPDGSVTPPIVGIALDGRNGTVEIRDTDGGMWDGDPVWDRAVGPMQFIPATWRAYGADGNGDGVSDPHNIYDAAIAAARYLCSNARSGIKDPDAAARAVRAYNNSDAYVTEVLAVADGYRAKSISLGITLGIIPTTTTTTTPASTTTTTIPATSTTTSIPASSTTTTAPPP